MPCDVACLSACARGKLDSPLYMEYYGIDWDHGRIHGFIEFFSRDVFEINFCRIIILQVSDDEESSMQSRSYHTGNDNKVEVDNDGVGGRGGGDRGAKAVRFSEPASGGEIDAYASRSIIRFCE